MIGVQVTVRQSPGVASEVQVTASNSDWFNALFAPVVIGRSINFAIGFSTVIWKPLYYESKSQK